jgi:hypothetical protein
LVGGVYGVEFGIGVGAGYVWSENVAGAASSQTITIDIATYGGTSTSTVNARIYYNLDPLDDPSTRVYSAMLIPLVNSASLSGTTTEGQTLTGANGIIVGGSPMTLTQQWLACDSGGANCANIVGATATTYLLTASEVGDTIKYTKTATNTAGSGSATSAASSVVVADVDPDAQAIIDEIESLDTTTLNAAQIAAINDFVVGAKALTVGASTAWVECEKIFCAIRATASSDTTGSARLNWKDPTGTKWAKIGTVTFSQLAGSLGQYLAAPDAITGVSNLGGKYTQNNASYGVYCGSEGAAARGNTYGAGSYNDASSRLSLWRVVDNNTVARINGTAAQTLVAATTAIGFHHVNRTDSSNIQYYRNGSLANSNSGATSSALPAQPFAICQAASVEDLCNRYSFAWYGSDMSTVAASWSTLCTTLMTDLQAA